MTLIDLVDDNILKDPIRYCIEIILKEARQEDRLVRQILYAMLSAYTNNPINLAINSPTGEGKSYVLTKVAEFFPEEDVIFLSHITNKALFHRQGQYVIRDDTGQYVPIDEKINEIDLEIKDKESEKESTNDENIKSSLGRLIRELRDRKNDLYKESKNVIDLSHKILIFLDTPQVGLFNAIMPLLSHDKYEVEYEFTDTHNGIRTKSNLIRGWPSVIFAAAVDYSHHKRWPEVQRRFIITNPKMTKEKYDDAVNFISEKFGVPDFVYQKTNVSDKEKEEVRSIIRRLREEILEMSRRLDYEKNNVIIPYNECIKSVLPRNSASDMTLVRLLYTFLSLLTLINIQHRPRISIFDKSDLTMRIFPFASFEDLNEALFLIEYANGVRPYVLEWFNNIFLESYDKKNQPDSRIITRGGEEREVRENRIGLTTEELVLKSREVQGKTYTKKKILDNFINPLMNQGHIDSMESELDRRSKIYYPTGMMTKNRKLFDSQSSNNYIDRISKISVDPASFPHKEYIISYIGRVLKYSEEEGVHATVLDHNGKEIRIEDVVTRYYDNPSDYFDSVNKELINTCEESSDNCSPSVENSDNSHMGLPSDLKIVKKSRQDQIEEQVDRMFAEYYENDEITSELEDT